MRSTAGLNRGGRSLSPCATGACTKYQDSVYRTVRQLVENKSPARDLNDDAPGPGQGMAISESNVLIGTQKDRRGGRGGRFGWGGRA